MKALFSVDPCGYLSPLLMKAVIVRIGERLDFRSADRFRTLCQEQLHAGAVHFILDFSQTRTLDSAGLGALFSLYRQLVGCQGWVGLACPSRAVEMVLRLTRTNRILPQFPSVEAACQALLHGQAGAEAREVL